MQLCSRCSAAGRPTRRHCRAESPLWANAGAGRILALPTGHRRRYVTAFHHPDTRREMVRRQGGDILRLLVRHRAGHFAGTTADAPLGIGNKKLVHPLLLGIKPQGARIVPCPRFDPEWNQRCFVRWPAGCGHLPDASRTVKPSSREIASAVSRSGFNKFFRQLPGTKSAGEPTLMITGTMPYRAGYDRCRDGG